MKKGSILRGNCGDVYKRQVVNRIDDFAYTPEQNIAHAMTALMAQNKGAGRRDRMREGFRCGLVLEVI